MHQFNHPDSQATHHTLERLLQHVVILGSLAVLLIPAVRGSSALIGWLPLWLMGMPLVAWWSLRRFPLPRLGLRMPRRHRVQAVRRPRLRRSAGLSRAA